MEKYFSDGETVRRAEAADEAALMRLLALAFGFDARRSAEYLGHAGPGAFRVVRAADGTLLACAALLPTAHRFGAEVPAASIAHVALAPEARGRGLARPFMAALCDDARGAGALMVSLFASARPVYRRCGFELAGHEIVYEADLAALPARGQGSWAEVDPRDPRIAAAYARKAAQGAGLIRRGAVHWAELLAPPTDALAAYALGGADLDAYVILDAGDPRRLVVRDWFAGGGAAAAEVLAFLGRFRSVYPVARWHGGPEDDLVGAMPDKGWRLVHQEEWLARILDLPAALAARRYLPRSLELGLRIGGTDLVLGIEDGRGTVREGSGPPAVTLGEADAASLFTGFRSATWLARAGALTGDARALALCDLAFAGPAPWVAEHF